MSSHLIRSNGWLKKISKRNEITHIYKVKEKYQQDLLVNQFVVGQQSIEELRR